MRRFLPVVLIGLITAACVPDGVSLSERQRESICFTVTTGENAATKAASDTSGVIALSLRGDLPKDSSETFIMTMVSSPMCALPTKAAPYATGALSTSVDLGLVAYTYAASNAAATAWTRYTVPAVTRLYSDKSRNDASSGKWIPAPEARLLWPREGYIRYFAYAPYSDSNSDGNDDNVTVTAEDGAAPTIGYTVKPVESQIDLLVADPSSTKEYSGDPGWRKIDVPLKLNHALTGIRFRIVEGLSIKSVKIVGVKDAGVLDLSNPASWTNLSGSATYELTNLSPGNGLHVDSDNPGYSIVDDDRILLLMPQTVPENALIRVVVTDGTLTNDIEASIRSQVWNPGQLITYTITRNPDLWNYTLSLSSRELVIKRGAFDGSGSCSLTSYRSRSGVRQELDVTVDYSLADADGNNLEQWSDRLPSGLNRVTLSGGETKSVVVAVAANTNPAPNGVIPELVYRAENMKSKPLANDLDLSLYDFGPLSSPRPSGKTTTANCYVIDRPGTFRFPLVYGNAIDYSREGVPRWDHGINYLSYFVERDNWGWNHFQRFDGKPISSPYILDDLGLNSSEVEAVVVWEETEGAQYAIFGNLSVQDRASSGVFYDPDTGGYKASVPYICFSIPQGTVDPNEQLMPTRRITGCRPGNALVALRLKVAKEVAGAAYPAGTILWSWHIWLTDGADTDGDYRGDSFEPITAVMRSSQTEPTADIMPLNLGWIESAQITLFKDRVFYIRFTQEMGSAEPVVLKVIQQMDPLAIGGSSVAYQWGRKDPMLPSINSRDIRGNWSSRNQTVWSPSAYTVVQSTTRLAFSGTPSADISSSVQNPHVFFSNLNDDVSGRAGFTFMCDNPYNLWNMRFRETKKYVYKTIYDPCPPGYCVPPEETFNFLITRGGVMTQIDFSEYSGINMVDLNNDGRFNQADIDNGIWFYVDDSRTNTIFIPVTGIRYYQSGEARYPSQGGLWTAGADGISGHVYGTGAGFSNDRVSIWQTPRSYGRAVRPVKEFQP